MKIAILGAGEIGRSLTGIFCREKHDVIVMDNSYELLSDISNKYDVLTVYGNGATSRVLKKVSDENADILIAVTGDDSTNIIACQIASNLGIETTYCRLSTMDYFAESSNFLPSLLGITNIIFPEKEVTEKIMNSIFHKSIIEKIEFDDPSVEISGFKITPASQIIGIRLRDFPDKELLEKIRFLAIIRDNEFIIPHGETIIASRDEIYAAGKKENITALIDWVSSDEIKSSAKKRIVLAGATKVGKMLAEELVEQGYDVRLIENDDNTCEKILNEISRKITVINGNPTDMDILDEAGVKNCHCYISVLKDDEDNILSCILAKRMKAQKVITVTNRVQYQEIVSAISSIDCCICLSLVAINSILKYFKTDKTRISAIFHRANAFIVEVKIDNKSKVCGKTIAECACPPDVIFAFIRRGNEILAATGSLKLNAGDMVAAVAEVENIKAIEKIFSADK